MPSTQHAIDHPGSIGVHNKHVLDTLSDAYRASLELAEQGLTVVSVRVEGRNPIILIKDSARCKALRGSSAAVRSGPRGREQMMVAVVKGCQVQWVVKGN